MITLAILDTPECTRMLHGLQIIVGAMCLGVIGFGVLAVSLPIGAKPALPFPGFMLCSGAVFTALTWMAGVVVGGAMLANARRRIAAGQQKVDSQTFGALRVGALFLPSSSSPSVFEATFVERHGDAALLCWEYRKLTVIRAALLEGSAFFMLVAYMLEGHWGSEALAALLIAGLILRIPTRGHLARWLDDQLQLVENQRSMGMR
ncbi:MAG: hypothetical protein ABSE73_06485 [Planctomycetota bacterium]